jgi:hypothetical protein
MRAIDLRFIVLGTKVRVEHPSATELPVASLLGSRVSWIKIPGPRHCQHKQSAEPAQSWQSLNPSNQGSNHFSLENQAPKNQRYPLLCSTSSPIKWSTKLSPDE